jgi:polar amino acid transport system substrate-binding protein
MRTGSRKACRWISRVRSARASACPVELVTFDSAGKVSSSVAQWDIAFLAVDPARATDIAFTAPYVMIEGAYLVPANSPIKSNGDVDRAGTRVVVGAGSAYDLYLSREIKAATLVRAPTSPAVVDVMVAQSLDVAAGVKQQLEADARRVANVPPAARSIHGDQPGRRRAAGRPAAAAYVAQFVEDVKASGFVAESLARPPHRRRDRRARPLGRGLAHLVVPRVRLRTAPGVVPPPARTSG